jgi:anti-sigma factor RsiW
MTKDPRYQHLLELSWRRKLTPAEEAEMQACLQVHPEAHSDWEAEAGLTEALGRLPDAPVPSNFTARVLQAIERETTAEARQKPASLPWLAPRWLPRVAFGAIVIGVGLLSYHEAKDVERKKMVNGVEVVSEVSSLPSPDILQDFDAIRALNRTPPADPELLSLFQ